MSVFAFILIVAIIAKLKIFYEFVTGKSNHTHQHYVKTNK